MTWCFGLFYAIALSRRCTNERAGRACASLALINGEVYQPPRSRGVLSKLSFYLPPTPTSLRYSPHLLFRNGSFSISRYLPNPSEALLQGQYHLGLCLAWAEGFAAGMPSQFVDCIPHLKPSVGCLEVSTIQAKFVTRKPVPFRILRPMNSRSLSRLRVSAVVIAPTTTNFVMATSRLVHHYH